MPVSIKWINKRKDLPKSFCLDNYAGTKNLDAGGWAQVLSHRARLKSYDIRPDRDSGAITDRFIHEVFKEPLKQSPLDIQISKTSLSKPPLKHLTVDDLHSLINLLLITQFDKEAKEVRTYFDDHMTDDKTTPKSLSASAEAFCMMTIDSMEAFPPRPRNINTCKIYLSVDLSCSDELLIQEFKHAITSAREVHGIDLKKDSNFNDSNFKNWHDLAILPYLDLCLWANANGVSIKPGLLSKVIYPDRDANKFGNSRKITDTVKTKATELMQREALKTLYVQAQDDLRRQRERKKPRLFF